MNRSFYVGSYRHDGLNNSHRGWIIGKFMENKPQKTDKVEVKYWEFDKCEDTKHPMKTSETIECTFILTGKTKAIINNETVILVAGDYIVIEPNVPNNVVQNILEDTTGITIKAPSDPSAKKVL